MQRVGGGEPTVWACSPNEEDPDKPGYLRRKKDRGGVDEHYVQSEYVDRRQGGDDLVIELVRRHNLLREQARSFVEALQCIETIAICREELGVTADANRRIRIIAITALGKDP